MSGMIETSYSMVRILVGSWSNLGASKMARAAASLACSANATGPSAAIRATEKPPPCAVFQPRADNHAPACAPMVAQPKARPPTATVPNENSPTLTFPTAIKPTETDPALIGAMATAPHAQINPYARSPPANQANIAGAPASGVAYRTCTSGTPKRVRALRYSPAADPT